MGGLASPAPVRGDWLTLGEASERLGVHPDTLRRWSDARRVPAWLTPGGHRRFARSSIEALTARIRRDPAVRGVAIELDPETRAALRRRGLLLVRLLRAYANAPDGAERARCLARAEGCGEAYGRDVRARAIPLAVAVRVLLAVRTHVVGELPAAGTAFDRVLIALTAAYAFDDARSRATIDRAAP